MSAWPISDAGCGGNVSRNDRPDRRLELRVAERAEPSSQAARSVPIVAAATIELFVSAESNYKRYLALARKASSSGDNVEMENCYQHAEHCFRMMRAGGRTEE